MHQSRHETDVAQTQTYDNLSLIRDTLTNVLLMLPPQESGQLESNTVWKYREIILLIILGRSTSSEGCEIPGCKVFESDKV